MRAPRPSPLSPANSQRNAGESQLRLPRAPKGWFSMSALWSGHAEFRSQIGHAGRRESERMTEAVISVIDDDDEVRGGIESLLRSLDYTVHTFASAEDFLESPQLHHCACIISDVRMPGLSGIELQETLVAEGHRIPVILITAHPDEHVRARAAQAGVASFMSKPVRTA